MNNFINIFEMSPRDGLQNEKAFITTQNKIKFIICLQPSFEWGA